MIPGAAWNPSMATCVPIPQDQQQPAPPPRPAGKWIKTWGAIAGDDVAQFGVSTGKLSKAEAEKVALEKCEGASQHPCRIIDAYENQCVAVASPPNGGVNIFEYGSPVDKISRIAIEKCQKHNAGSQCKIGYSNCTEQIFQKF